MSRVSPKRLERTALTVFKFLHQKEVFVEINLIPNEAMRLLNRRFRHKDTATNVLSFIAPKDFPSPEHGLRYLGDVYLAPSYIKFHNENIEQLLIHGILHLLGYNHTQRRARMRMQKLEDSLWRIISSSD